MQLGLPGHPAALIGGIVTGIELMFTEAIAHRAWGVLPGSIAAGDLSCWHPISSPTTFYLG